MLKECYASEKLIMRNKRVIKESSEYAKMIQDLEF